MDKRDLYDIRGEIKALEYELMEEQFRYDSIPRRKAMTASKARLNAAAIIIVTVIMLAVLFPSCIYVFGSSLLDELPMMGVLVAQAALQVTWPVIVFGLLMLDITLIRDWLAQMDLIIGRRKKTLNSHLTYFKGFNNCYILLYKYRLSLENTKVFVGVLLVTSCIVLYRFTLVYEPS